MSKPQLPDYMKGHKEFTGVCIGACILTKKWVKGKRIKDDDGNFIKDKNDKYVREPEAAAHAHTHPKDPAKGIICFRSMREFKKETTVKHELAHIITSEGHTKNWAEQYVALGTPKWLTVEWLQKKYGFDDNGGEGTKLVDEMKERVKMLREQIAEGKKT